MGSISPTSALRGSGEVVICRKCFRKVSTPKLVRADPKNTGGQLSLAYQLLIKLRAGAVQQLDVVHQLFLLTRIENAVNLRIVDGQIQLLALLVPFSVSENSSTFSVFRS